METRQQINVRHRIVIRSYESPCGTLVLGDLNHRLCLCDWTSGIHHERTMNRLSTLLEADFKIGFTSILDVAAQQLDEYFTGKRRTFSVPLQFAGTDFQRSVWTALTTIPYATTMSYSELARRIDRPAAVRAVANANGANALSVFVPCHRVIGSDRTLTGYGGGLTVKRFLLQLECSSPAI
ncbi:MAG: methylated-DNA--[protein]-cysteine S-methyltransferase [Clostridium sp.]|nr:methylated-DNA--[protein]-cysteine S-methyltransferase [Clostridium sp.]